MRKSSLYHLAMRAVINSDYRDDIKIDILDVLNENRRTELWLEAKESNESEEAEK